MKNLNINEQNLLTIQGARKILSCTQSQAVIETDKKRIVVSGNDIEVKNLNLENCEVCLFGHFSNLKFIEEHEKKPFLKRIFK